MPDAPIEPGTLPATWYARDPTRGGRPDFCLHAYNDDFQIFRQAGWTSFEKPFLYLIFGQDRAILFDTGAGNVDVRGAVDDAIRVWLTRHGRGSIPLIVAHSHGHSDHVAGDGQFLDRPDTTVVSTDPDRVRDFFAIPGWPDGVAEVLQVAGDRIRAALPAGVSEREAECARR